MVEYQLDVKVTGSKVTFGLQVANRGTRPHRCSFTSSQEYDFVVELQGVEIWRWSADKGFAMLMHEKTLRCNQPGPAYRVSWDQRDGKGVPVKPAIYKVKAYFLGMDRRQPVAEKDFAIQ
ncbi:MAG TPA: BsuPI-related putative proteinase inhibitor [Bacillota bacterium]|nr:BsuPI-related putative proteinase inhibitor [Bacillota bacterium]